MSLISDTGSIIENFISSSDKPVVIFSGMWPFFKLINKDPKDVTESFVNTLMQVIGENRGLLMPTFSDGYSNGVCNLDEEPSKNGVLTEQFRKTNNVHRTLSAFFSFCIWSNNQNLVKKVIDLQPKYAWGDGSLYEWMELENVHFIMLGVHPITCSYLHRMEWLVADRIRYRYNKLFSGRVIRDGNFIDVEETLFVRSLNPPVVHDFYVIYENLLRGGLEVEKTHGISIAHMRAQNIKKILLPLIKEDPFVLVKNREDFL